MKKFSRLRRRSVAVGAALAMTFAVTPVVAEEGLSREVPNHTSAETFSSRTLSESDGADGLNVTDADSTRTADGDSGDVASAAADTPAVDDSSGAAAADSSGVAGDHNGPAADTPTGVDDTGTVRPGGDNSLLDAPGGNSDGSAASKNGAAHPSADAADYIVIATNSAKVNTGSRVSGNVAVNTQAAGATLEPGFEFSLERTGVVNGDVAADDIQLGRVSTVDDDAYYVTSAVVNTGVTVDNVIQTVDLLPVVTPPAFQPATPGTTDVSVPNGTSTTLASGAYGVVTVGAGASLILDGDYDFGSLSAGIGTSVLASGPTNVRIAGTLFVGKNSFVETTAADMVSPWDYVFHVGGTNLDPVDPLSSPAAAWVGRDSALGASIFAPNGTVRLDNGIDGSTQVVGLDVRIEKDQRLTLPPLANDVDVSVSEDGPAVAGSSDASSADPAATLTYFVVDGPAKGSLTYNTGDGTFTFDPNGEFEALNDGQTEDVTFTYIAKANGVASNVATVTVTVIGETDGVTAVDDEYGTDENTALAVAAPGVLGNDGDPDGTATVVPIANGQSSLGGGVNVAGDGSFTYNPDGEFESLGVGESAEDTFTYTAQNAVSSSSATVTVTVDGVNDTPTAESQAVDNTSTSFTITLNGIDPDSNDDLEFAIVTPPGVDEGTLTLLTNSDGTCSPIPCSAIDKNSATVLYTRPAAGAVFTTFTFSVDDLNGGTDTATVTINPSLDPTPEPPEDPPGVANIVAEDDVVETDENVAVDVVLHAAAESAIGDLTFSILTAPPVADGALTDLDDLPGTPVRTGTVTFTPAVDFVGSTSFEFEACEVASPANCDQGVVTVIVEAAADPVSPVAPDVRDLNVAVESNKIVSFDLSSTVGTSGAGEPCEGCGRRPAPGALSRSAGAQRDSLSSVTDPAGDSAAGEPDLVSMDVGVTAAINNVAFDVKFDPQTFDAATSRATIVIDIDQVVTCDDPPSCTSISVTGFPGVDGANNDANLMGNEYLINVGGDLGATAEVLEWQSGTSAPADYDLVGTVPITVNSDGYYLNFDLGLLGDDDGFFNYKVLTQRYLGPGYTGIQDYMTDLGSAPGTINPNSNLASGPVQYTVLSLPSFGALSTADGTPVTGPVGLFGASKLTFDPEGGSGPTSFTYEVKNTALISTIATVFINVTAATCAESEAACNDGR